jgi:hypothetical protein
VIAKYHPAARLSDGNLAYYTKGSLDQEPDAPKDPDQTDADGLFMAAAACRMSRSNH